MPTKLPNTVVKCAWFSNPTPLSMTVGIPLSLLGLGLRAWAAGEPEQPPDNPSGQFAPNAFIRIDNAGRTTLVIP